jgi:phosphatidylserine decarboxylase
MQNNLFILHKHSFKYIAYAFAAFLLLSMLDLELLATAAFIFMLICAYLFRNPEKSFVSYEKNALVSPVDGKVVKIEEIEDDRYGYRVEIESGYLDVSVLRVPFESTLKEMNLVNGTRVSTKSKLFNKLNEYASLELADDNEHTIKLIHRLGRSFAPLYIDIYKDEKLQNRARYGVMLNGITTIYLPKSFKLNVNVGNQISGSETLLGYFL